MPPTVTFQPLPPMTDPCVDLRHPRRRAPARRRAATCLEHIEAASMLDARADIKAVDAVDAKQLIGHARDRRRSVDLQIGDAIGALVPSRSVLSV
jgi:hypothetical protein